MKTNQHGVLICRVCNQNKERRSQVYRGVRGDYVLGRAIHRKMVEGVKKLPQSTPLPAPSGKEPFWSPLRRRHLITSHLSPITFKAPTAKPSYHFSGRRRHRALPITTSYHFSGRRRRRPLLHLITSRFYTAPPVFFPIIDT